MATSRPGRSAVVLSSVPLQSLLYFTAIYYIFYFLCTLSMIIYKSGILSYPDENISCDVGLLFLMAGIELLRFYFGMKGNLIENERYVVASLALTGTTVLLSVYFLAWQSYVLRADIIINAVLLVAYGLGGVMAFITVTSFTRSEFRSQ